MKLQYVAMEEQIADVLTNPLDRLKIGVLQIEAPSEEK